MDYTIPDQYYSNNYFVPGEFYNIPSQPAAVCANAGGIAMCNEETLPILNKNEDLNMLPLMSSSEINYPVSLTEQLGVSGMAMQALTRGYRGFCEFGSASGGFEGRYHHELYEPSGYCNGFMMPNLCSSYPRADETWGIQGKTPGNVEETAMKVGRYSMEERKDRILRYLKKRNQRNFNKTIKYACRKTLADKRVRIRGRFAKNNEPSEDEAEKKIIDSSCEENSTYYDDSIQIKYDDEDEWLQAAMSSLMYFPYISS